jgi:hypothetical protein
MVETSHRHPTFDLSRKNERPIGTRISIMGSPNYRLGSGRQWEGKERTEEEGQLEAARWAQFK